MTEAEIDDLLRRKFRITHPAWACLIRRRWCPIREDQGFARALEHGEGSGRFEEDGARIGRAA